MKKRIAALLLSLALLPALASGCAREPQLQALDLTKAISAREIDTDGALIESSALAATDFCVELFQESCLHVFSLIILVREKRVIDQIAQAIYRQHMHFLNASTTMRRNADLHILWP